MLKLQNINNFLNRNIYVVCRTNLRSSLNIQKQKVFQLQGGFTPLTPRPGALSLDLAGGSAPDPRYRLALLALAMAPPLPNSKYATAYYCS